MQIKVLGTTSNTDVGLGAANTITGNSVKSVDVATNGVITITYNTKVENNKTLIMSPTNAQGSIKWDCTSTAANTVAAKYRPATCRP